MKAVFSCLEEFRAIVTDFDNPAVLHILRQIRSFLLASAAFPAANRRESKILILACHRVTRRIGHVL